MATLTAFRDAAAAAVPRPGAVARRGVDLGRPAADLAIKIHADLAAIEAEWRSFQHTADCTPFQCFDWLAAWQRHVGVGGGVRPAVVIGRDVNGRIAFIWPFGVLPGGLTTTLRWLGDDLCDYNAPLLARDFTQMVPPQRFPALWHDVEARLQAQAHWSLKWPPILGPVA